MVAVLFVPQMDRLRCSRIGGTTTAAAAASTLLLLALFGIMRGGTIIGRTEVGSCSSSSVDATQQQRDDSSCQVPVMATEKASAETDVPADGLFGNWFRFFGTSLRIIGGGEGAKELLPSCHIQYIRSI